MDRSNVRNLPEILNHPSATGIVVVCNWEILVPFQNCNFHSCLRYLHLQISVSWYPKMHAKLYTYILSYVVIWYIYLVPWHSQDSNIIANAQDNTNRIVFENYHIANAHTFQGPIYDVKGLIQQRIRKWILPVGCVKQYKHTCIANWHFQYSFTHIWHIMG